MKYLKKTYSLMLWMMLGIIVAVPMQTVVGELYRFLGGFLPSLFPTFDFTTERDLYYMLSDALMLASLAATIYTVTYLSMQRNNDRFEFMISKTDGFYKVKEVLKTYIDNFLLSDLLASLFVGVVFTLPFIFIPEQFIERGSLVSTLFSPYKTATLALGNVGGVLFGVGALVVSHLISIPLALKYYRAKWLSGFVEGAI